MLLLLFRPPVAVAAAAAVGGRHLQRRQDDGGRVPHAKDNVGAEDVLHAHGSGKKKDGIDFFVIHGKNQTICAKYEMAKSANVNR